MLSPCNRSQECSIVGCFRKLAAAQVSVRRCASSGVTLRRLLIAFFLMQRIDHLFALGLLHQIPCMGQNSKEQGLTTKGHTVLCPHVFPGFALGARRLFYVLSSILVVFFVVLSFVTSFIYLFCVFLVGLFFLWSPPLSRIRGMAVYSYGILVRSAGVPVVPIAGIVPVQ